MQQQSRDASAITADTTRSQTNANPGAVKRRLGKAVLLCAFGLLCASQGLQAASIQFLADEVGTTPGGDRIFRFMYSVTGPLTVNQEVDIRFDPALYRDLTNESGGSDFDIMLFQPDNPPGSFGDFSALALVDNPDLDVPFLVDATYFGSGLPGPQQFFINTYNGSGQLVSSESGITFGPSNDPAVPEPGTREIGFVGLAAVCTWYSLRRSRKPVTP